MPWLLLLLTLFPVFAQAKTWPVRDLAVLSDPQGSETLSAVSQPAEVTAFTPLRAGLAAGYTRHVHWLRFSLDAPPPDPSGRRALLLKFDPPYLDDLRIYVPDASAPGGFVEYRHGDRLPFAERVYHHRSFVQRVIFPDAQPMTLYARLQTSSSSVLVATAQEPSRFIDQVIDEYALLGVFFGLLLAGLVSNLWFGLRGGDPLYRPFLYFLGATFLMLAGINGLHAQYLLPFSPILADRWVPLSVILTVLTGTHFYRQALAIDTAPTWMRGVFRGIFWFALLCLPTPLVDRYTEVAQFLMYALLLMLLTALWRAMQLWGRNTGNGLIMIALAFSLLGSMAAALTLVGLLPGHFWLIYGSQLGSLGTLASLQLLVAQRARATEARATQAQAAAELAEAVAGQERQARETQQRFLSMLTHELKTPLSVIRMRLSSSKPSAQMQTHAHDAVQEIASLVDRCALASRLDHDAITIQRQACHLDSLLQELVESLDPATRLHLSLPEGKLALSSDPMLVRVALGNLIENALKYSPAGSGIDIAVAAETRAGRPGWRVRVSNPVGPAGRPESAQVFQRYYRAPGAHGHSGSGLGLYIVQGLATLLGGELRYLEQEPDITFELWLPR